MPYATILLSSQKINFLREVVPFLITDQIYNIHSLLSSSSSLPSFSSLPSGSTPYEFLLSYVHKEASTEALSLKEALQDAGFRVFLDVDCIQSGTDWQDVLNDAVSNCTVFVPLVSLQYGQTLWTNREVKLADVLGKLIIPVNLLDSWPPKCLAIQFSTTQFISWPCSVPEADRKGAVVGRVCAGIIQRYNVEVRGQGVRGEGVRSEGVRSEGVRSEGVRSVKEVRGVIMAEGAEEEEEEEEGMEAEERMISISRMDTDITVDVTDEEATQILEGEGEESVGVAKTDASSSLFLPPLLSLTQRRSTLKSYASALPPSLPETYRRSIQESREGKPLVVISCHSAQREFAGGLVSDMERRGYEAWCSCDLSPLTEESSVLQFQQKADEAGAVAFVFSSEFTDCGFCEQQVYYCEQRKQIIPLVFGAVQLPHWASMLIGTSVLIDCRATSFKDTLFKKLEESLNPRKREMGLQAMLREKREVAELCVRVSARLPPGHLVYISGGTKFFSPCGEEICCELGKQLAQDPHIILVTGGFFGVGETVGRSFHEQRVAKGRSSGVWHVVAERDVQDRSSQTRQNTDGSFPAPLYGHTIFAGRSVRQREVVTPGVINICVLVEGGPGAAFEAQQFAWRGNWVIPVIATGGAAGGLFNVPQTIFERPPCILEADWSLLGDKEAPPSQIAAAVVRIIRTLAFELSVTKGSSGSGRRGRRRGGRRRAGRRGTAIERSDTAPAPNEAQILQPMKRTFSESKSAAARRSSRGPLIT